MRFKKDLPGALIRFQPKDLPDYRGEPWDVRISLGDAPLEEAFYITVRDREPEGMTLRQVLQQFVLDRQKRFELDIEHFPQLPNLQEELIQHWEAHQKNAAGLEIWVNHGPGSRPPSLDDPLESWISTCTFEDGSFDYRLLDLVWVVEPPVPSEEALEALSRDYGALFALLILDYRLQVQTDSYEDWIRSRPFKDFHASRQSAPAFPRWTAALQSAQAHGWLDTTEDTLSLSLPGQPPRRVPTLTPSGLRQAEVVRSEMERLAAEYNAFASVWAYPPTLGVPDGFDARLQLMRRQEPDFLKSCLLMNLDAHQEEVLGGSQALEDWESGRTFQVLLAGMAYETAFSEEILERLKKLAATHGHSSHP